MTFRSSGEEYFSCFLFLSLTHGFGRVLKDYIASGDMLF